MHILQMGKHPEGPESLSKTRVNQNKVVGLKSPGQSLTMPFSKIIIL